MLQQTQVSRVLEKYPAFLAQFPTLHSLARAQRSHVIRTWRGMGYNNRAVRLHGAVREVVAGYNGSVPRDTGALAALLSRYAADPEKLATMGREARERLDRDYSYDRVVDGTLAALRFVTGRDRPQCSAD
jgi:A/G-specific adenine glycosylase